MKENTNFKKMEELDARVEKINYDLMGLENRKKEMEDAKIEKQKEIDKLESEKCNILEKTDKMKPLQKFLYVVISLKTDLKRVDLINAKVSEYQKEKNNIQNKIDIQNGLYAETIKEKDKYVEQRRELYIESTNTLKKQQEINQGQIRPTDYIQDLVEIHKIAKKHQNSKSMKNLRTIVESQISQLLKPVENKGQIKNKREPEKQDEME